MTSPIVRATSRRRFLQYLAASPLFASGALSADSKEVSSKLPDPMIWAPADGELIGSPKDAINVFDFEPVARNKVPPAHFGYMASGLDDEVTLRANREGFLRFQLLPRRLNDVSKIDTGIELFGTRYDSPIFVCPTGGNMFFVAGRNQETLLRLMRTDTRECSGCHDRSSFAARSVRRHNYDGIDLTSITGSGESSNLSWDTVKRMRDITRMKIVLKGIVTPEDADLAVQNGIDGILVSNHGGRGEDNGRSTIDALPEIIAAVKGRIPVIVDGGFRRGTDAVKALAMGAQAVGIGRPYLWGLGAFGQEGVERVLEIMRTETRAAMQQCGVRSVKELNPGFVRRAS